MLADVQAQWRRLAAHDLVARGLAITVLDDEGPVAEVHPIVQRLVAGTASARDALHFVDQDQTGIWWGVLGRDFDLVDVQDYAAPTGLEESMAKSLPECEADLADGRPAVWGELAVVLVGNRPAGWDPTDQTGAGPLMGNSYMDRGTRIPLTEVHYNAGNGWRIVSASGVTVTT